MVKNLAFLLIAFLMAWGLGTEGNPDRDTFYTMLLSYIVLNMNRSENKLN
ncbi:hypothetical protein [Niallia taxi]